MTVAQYLSHKALLVEAVQYAMNEYADYPYEVRGEVPDWFVEAVETEKIKAAFAGEDYWYLDVSTPETVVRIGPDDWIVKEPGDGGGLYGVTSGDFKRLYAQRADALPG